MVTQPDTASETGRSCPNHHLVTRGKQHYQSRGLCAFWAHSHSPKLLQSGRDINEETLVVAPVHLTKSLY
eukprot:6174012-Pleurochrysis_carterae.AAC.3